PVTTSIGTLPPLAPTPLSAAEPPADAVEPPEPGAPPDAEGSFPNVSCPSLWPVQPPRASIKLANRRRPRMVTTERRGNQRLGINNRQELSEFHVCQKNIVARARHCPIAPPRWVRRSCHGIWWCSRARACMLEGFESPG